ncbi:MAG: T9SS type A sorting domain-containing protein [Saprospiraceae bacterium]|nr:T9SS type A sorting domain-containing protein [Saprospiraceae bacterium]
MRRNILKLTILFLSSFVLVGLHAQEAIPASGGNASGSGGSVSYSIGQMVYSTNTGTNGSVAQGVQQPFEISEVIGLEEAKGISLKCTAFPNPTTEFLTLKVDASSALNIQSLNYQLYDISGKLLESKKLTSNEITISMANFVTATYFLKVCDKGKELKIFKIIKK